MFGGQKQIPRVRRLGAAVFFSMCLFRAVTLGAQPERVAVKLAWDPSPEPTVIGYIVYYGSRSQAYTSWLYSGELTNATVPNLKAGHRYFFAVTAIDYFSRQSELSEEVEFQIPSPCEQTVALLPIADPILPGTFHLTLLPEAGAKYQFQTSTNGQDWEPLWTAPVAGSNLLDYVITDGPNSDQRFYRAEVESRFHESSTPITQTQVLEPVPGTKIQFGGSYGRVYAVQASEDGISWTDIGVTTPLQTNALVEILDSRPTAPAPQYRLLEASDRDGPYWGPCGGILNDAPVITVEPSSPRLVAMSTPSDPIFVTISDPDTPADDLIVSAGSSDPAIVSPDQITWQVFGSSRSVILNPAPGVTGTVSVQFNISDGDNNASATWDLEVVRSLPDNPQLALDKQGLGTVVPDLNNQQLTPGKRYKIKAIPGPGQVFAGWSGATSSVSATLTFTMHLGLVLQANFVPNPFLVCSGEYDGLIAEDSAAQAIAAGAIRINVTSRGSYTGQLNMGGHRHGFSGQLALDRKVTNTVTRAGLPSVVLNLAFGEDSSAPLQGDFNDGFTEIAWQAQRSGFDGRLHPAPTQGSYTMAFLRGGGGDLGPDGAGYGTVKVDRAGAASFVGTLADGTKLSCRAPLSALNQWPFYASLYRGQGFLTGWLTLTNQSTNDLSGTTRWVRPAAATGKYYTEGFSNALVVVGSGYTRPPAGTYPILTLEPTPLSFSGGNLANAFTNFLSLDARNKIVNLGSNRLSLVVSLSSGLFSGSVVDPSTAKSSTFRGALLEAQRIGAGFLLGTNRSALVSLGF